MSSASDASACNFYDVTDDTTPIIVAAGSGAKLNITNAGPSDHHFRVGMWHVANNQPDKIVQYVEPNKGASVYVFSGGDVDRIQLERGSDWQSRDIARVLVCTIP